MAGAILPAMNQNEAHLRMLLPYDEALPPTLGGALPDIPAIWRRAHTFFDRVIEHIGSLYAFSRRPALKRDERVNLLDRLKPVERIVRAVLVMRALTYLMMTPAGRKLRRETPRLVWPPVPRPDARADAQPDAQPDAGTPPATPCETTVPELQTPMSPPAFSFDAADPARKISPFRVIRLRPPRPDTGDEQDEDAEHPEPEPGVRGEEKARPPGAQLTRRRAGSAALLVRRIEALGRALENPDALIPDLARFLASLPPEALEDLAVYLRPLPGWVHGHHDLVALRQHMINACRIYCRKPEPG